MRSKHTRWCRRKWNTSVSRSEEHTSELQSQSNLVCRLLLEKKKNFESDAFTNQLLLVAIRVRGRSIAKRLPYARIVRWDKDWACVWDLVLVWQVDERCADHLRDREADVRSRARGR